MSYLFGKGLGDSASWAAILLLHQRRGKQYSMVGWCADASWALGRYLLPPDHKWGEHLFTHHHVPMRDAADVPAYNETAINVSGGSVANIGTPHELWQELCDARPEVPDRTPEEWDAANKALDGIDGKFIVFQAAGWSYRAEKSLLPQAIPQYAAALADATGAWVLVDDHYKDGEFAIGRCNHPRVRYMPANGMSMASKFEVISRSSLIVGIDSGYLHVGRLAWDVPSIGLWFSRHCFAGRYTLPTPKRLNLYPAIYQDWYEKLGPEWNCQPCGIAQIPKESLAEHAKRIIG